MEKPTYETYKISWNQLKNYQIYKQNHKMKTQNKISCDELIKMIETHSAVLNERFFFEPKSVYANAFGININISDKEFTVNFDNTKKVYAPDDETSDLDTPFILISNSGSIRVIDDNGDLHRIQFVNKINPFLSQKETP